STAKIVCRVFYQSGFLKDYPGGTSSGFQAEETAMYQLVLQPSWLDQSAGIGQEESEEYRPKIQKRSHSVANLKTDNPLFPRIKERTIMPGVQELKPIQECSHEIALKLLIDEHTKKLIKQDLLYRNLSIGLVDKIFQLTIQICSHLYLNVKHLLKLEQSQKSSFQFGPQEGKRMPSLNKLGCLGRFPANFSCMNINSYVHVKKLLVDQNRAPDGLRASFVQGIVFSRPVVSKSMAQCLLRPRILLLACSINYERNQNRMTWLENHAVQENKYLSNCVKRVVDCQPNLVLVKGTVSHDAQEALENLKISLICNVKSSVMARVSAATGADLVDSVDTLSTGQLGSATKLGLASSFRVEKIMGKKGSYKLLSIIEIFSPDSTMSSHRQHFPAVSVLLKGHDLAQLIRLKNSLKFALYAYRNCILEKHFLTDTKTALNPAIEDKVRDSLQPLDVFQAFSKVPSPKVQVSLSRQAWAGVGGFLSMCTKYLNKESKMSSQLNATKLQKSSVLEPRLHQYLDISYTLFAYSSDLFPRPCLQINEMRIGFYDLHDAPLGYFLEQFCFSPDDCPNLSCSAHITEHTQRFFHASGAVVLKVQQTFQTASEEGSNSGIVVCVSCARCLTSTDPQLLSEASWNLSFAKFLDLLINSPKMVLQSEIPGPDRNNQLCKHASHKGLQYWFAKDNRTAIFKQHPVIVFEVLNPSPRLYTVHTNSLKLCRRVPTKKYPPALVNNEAADLLDIDSERFDSCNAASILGADQATTEILSLLSNYYSDLHDEMGSAQFLNSWSIQQLPIIRHFNSEGFVHARVTLLAHLVDYTANNTISHESTSSDGVSTSSEHNDDCLSSLLVKLDSFSNEYKINLIQNLVNEIRRWVYLLAVTWDRTKSSLEQYIKQVQFKAVKRRGNSESCLLDQDIVAGKSKFLATLAREEMQLSGSLLPRDNRVSVDLMPTLDESVMTPTPLEPLAMRTQQLGASDDQRRVVEDSSQFQQMSKDPLSQAILGVFGKPKSFYEEAN
ncbi:hypothetical protein Ciccas_011643, partial [Cichlidogyrus casuarinus]